MSESQLDLSEFVSKLIHDTFNAITVSSKEQAEMYFELSRLAGLDYETFKHKYIRDDDIEAELIRLFPVENNEEHLHGIYVDAPYKYTARSKTEEPDFKNILGIETDDNQHKVKKLLAGTVSAAWETVKDNLAGQHYSAFKEIVKRGIPRVIIDSGRILAKISLNATETESESNTGETAPALTGRPPRVVSTASGSTLTAATLKNTLISANIAKKIASTRVNVVLPDPKNPSTQTTTNLWGEVEIKFRTID